MKAMTCEKCGSPMTVDKSEGATESGEFREEHSCVHGHTGTVKGDAANHPSEWNYYGPAFEGK
jgi:hypothetical protein